MRSTVEAFGQIINCRQLVLQIRFYGLEHSQVDDLARIFYYYVSEQFGPDSVLDWRFQNKVLKDLEISLRNDKNSFGLYSLTLQGDFITETVYNKTSLLQYSRRLQNDRIFNCGDVSSFCATDYQAYRRKQLDPFENDPLRFSSALYRLFLLDHSETLRQYREHDLNGYFGVSCYEQNPDFLFGKLYLGIPVFCLGDATNDVALGFAEFAKECADLFKNLNVAVSLSTKPMGNEHEEYYFGLKNEDEKPFREWQNLAHTLYQFNVGWCNILSPATRALEEKLRDRFEPMGEGIIGSECSNGCLFLQCNKPISACTQMDLVEMKSQIYGTLFPGKMDYLYSFGFRKYWENVPVLQEEIIPLGNNRIRFSHAGKLNVHFLEENTGFRIDASSKRLRAK